MARVFLSYGRGDLESARRLADVLAGAGHEVWWDRHLQAGSRFISEIDRQLKEAEAVIVLWSETSINSAWVQDEAAEGRDSERLIPVALDAAKPPLGFRQFHTIPCEATDELLGAIARTCKPAQHDAIRSEPPRAVSTSRKATICVLPFTNMSGEPEQEYFSDGITEDIITDLSKVSALSVIARNTAFSFKGQSVDVTEVSKKMGVSHVLEGSVRKAGNRVRITAQLINGAGGDHVWAERYDRDLTDIFVIQDEISRAIVDALQLTLLPKERQSIERRGTTSVEAYNLYLMARQQWISGTFGDVRRDEAIVRLCREATTLLDPNYAQAWALMALAQAELRFWHSKDVNALAAAERALEIDPKLPEAHCIKARYLEEEGRVEDAGQQIRTALQLDPNSWEVNREAARMMFRQGHISEAIPYFEKAMSLMDSDYHNSAMLMTCYEAVGELEKLKESASVTLKRTERAVAEDPTNGSALAFGARALATLGEAQRAKEWIRRALLLDPDNLSMRYNLACSLVVQLHEDEEALNVLKPFFDQVNSSTHIKHMEADPDFDNIRHEPRFQKMLASAKERLGLD